MIKRGIFMALLGIVFWANTAFAQNKMNLSLDSCIAMAMRNYPLVKQYELVEKSVQYSIENLNKANTAKLNLGAQATYQSEVTALPLSIPGLNIDQLSKDQYRFYGEISQPITSLFTRKNQRELIETNAAIENQKIEVELYKIKERINNLYFGILLLDAQIRQAQLLINDLNNGIDKINSAIANGIALPSNADNLQAEKLKVNQKIIQLQSNKDAYLSMLSYFIDKEIGQETIFEEPKVLASSETISRPEMTLFELQQKSFKIQDGIINNKSLPQVNLFLQSGLGRPALNMLNNDFKGYYIGGIRLNWNISNFYTNNTEKRILAIGQSSIEVQKNLFLFNTHLVLAQQNEDVVKIEKLIESDDQIIGIRERIKNTTKLQLENGTATANDYLVAVNAQDQAQQNRLLHQIQLLMALYNIKTTTGN